MEDQAVVHLAIPRVLRFPEPLACLIKVQEEAKVVTVVMLEVVVVVALGERVA